MPLTPEQLDALAADAVAGEGVREPFDVFEPVPPQQQPQPEKRAVERFEAGARRGIQAGLGTQRAEDQALELLGRGPEDIPERPSLLESGLVAVLPKRERRDNRPLSASETARATAASIAETLIPIPGPLVKTAAVERLFDVDIATPKEQIFGREETFDEDARGLLLENNMMWLLRVLGSGAGALITEGVFSIPAIPQAQNVDLDQVEMAGTFAELQDAIYGEGARTYGELVLGIENKDRGFRIDRSNEAPGADWLQRGFEKVENGSGLEVDVAASFAERFGAKPYIGPMGGERDLVHDAGFGLGMLLDVFTNWEGALARPITLAADISRRANQFAELGDTTKGWEKFIKALNTTEMDFGEYTAKHIIEGLKSGRMTWDEVPEVMRLRAEEVAQTRLGLTFEEVLRRSGIEVPEPVAPKPGTPAAREAAERAAVREAGQRQAAGEDTLQEAQGSVERGALSPDDPDFDPLAALKESIQDQPPPPAPGEALIGGRSRVSEDDLRGMFLEAQRLRKRLEAIARRTPEEEGALAEMRNIEAEALDALGLAEARGVIFPEGLREQFRAASRLRRLEEIGQTIRPANDPRGFPGEDPGAFATRAARGTREALPQRPAPPEDLTTPDADAFFEAIAGQAWGLFEGAGYKHTSFNSRVLARPPRPAPTPDDTIFQLRNFKGEVVPRGVGTFEDLLEQKMKRQLDGDEIWYGDERRVTTWAKKDEPRLVASHFFASGDERAIVKNLLRTDPRARPTLQRAPGTPTVKVGASEVTPAHGVEAIFDAVTNAPIRRFAPITASDDILGEVLLDAGRLWAREKLGTSKLEPLANGALVTKFEKRTIEAATTTAMRDAGLPLDRIAGKVANEVPLTDVEQKGARLLAETGGISFLDGFDETGVLNSKTWKALNIAMLEDVGGAAADASFHIRGTQRWTEQLMGALATAHTDQKLITNVGDRLLRKLAPVTARFFDNPRANLSKQASNTLRELELSISSINDRLADQVRTALREKDGPLGSRDMAQILHRIAKDYLPVTEAERGLALAAREEGALREAGSALALRDQIKRTFKGKGPAWLRFEDEAELAHGILGWSERVSGRAVRLAKDFLKSALPEQRVKGTVLEEAFDHIPESELLRVYEEVFQAGNLDAPIIGATLRKVSPSAQAVRSEEAMLEFVLRQQIASELKTTMSKLLHDGLALTTKDPRAGALQSVLQGTHTTRLDDGSLRFAFPESTVGWAETMLRRWGLAEGDGTLIRTVQGLPVQAPEFLARDLERMIDLARLDSRAIFATGKGAEPVEKGADHLFRYFKKWTTHGVILPNPGYFMGQLMAMYPTLVTTQGWAAANRAVYTLTRHPNLIGQMLRRTQKGHPSFPRFGKAESVLVADNGLTYTIDEIVDALKRHGLDQSQIRVENMEQLADVLRREGSDGMLQWNRLAGRPLAEVQRQIEDWASAFDQAARFAVLLDNLKAGAPMAEAANKARVAVLDFNDLTAWERSNARRWVTFYAFLRKNADAYVKALFENPERFFSQARIAHTANRAWFDDRELIGMTERDIARTTVYSTEGVVRDGKMHPLYRTNALQSTPNGIVEFLASVPFLGQPYANTSETSQTIAELNPAVETALIQIGMMNGRGWALDNHAANRVPPWLTRIPGISGLLMDIFDVGPVSQREWEDQLLADPDASGPGLDGVWVAGGASATNEEANKARKRWQIFRTWLGRPVSTLTQFDRATFGEPRPSLTAQQELFSALSGLRWTPVRNEEEVRRLKLVDRDRATRSDTHLDVTALPDELRPR